MRRGIFLLGLSASLTTFAIGGCAHPGATAAASAPPTLKGDPAYPGYTTGWVDTKLYFGIGSADIPSAA
jgi:hypothetical protein